MNQKNNAAYPVEHISISINKPADKVYRYASNPENMFSFNLYLSELQ